MTGLRDHLRTVPAPEPVLSREREAELTTRQREILDEMGRIFDKGFVDVTMAELASQLNCSLRTLYGLAEGRNALVMMVVDRNLRHVGRTARRAIVDDMSALEAVRAYLAAATVGLWWMLMRELPPDAMVSSERHRAVVVRHQAFTFLLFPFTPWVPWVGMARKTDST